MPIQREHQEKNLRWQPPEIVQFASFVHVAKYMPVAMFVQGRLQLPPAVVAEQFHGSSARLGSCVPLIVVGGCVGHCFTARTHNDHSSSKDQAGRTKQQQV
jgi:hypothetical protein